MLFFRIILVTDKDAQTKFSWRPYCQLYVRGREDMSSIVCEALFSCPPDICGLPALEMLSGWMRRLDEQTGYGNLTL